jgi:hypothetical protein
MPNVRASLRTWGGRAPFQYEGSVRQGTKIYCGRDFRSVVRVTATQYSDMLRRFAGQEVSIGSNRTDPPDGSLGKWFRETYNQYSMTSYIGAILIAEGWAERCAQPDRILVGRESR